MLAGVREGVFSLRKGFRILQLDCVSTDLQRRSTIRFSGILKYTKKKKKTERSTQSLSRAARTNRDFDGTFSLSAARFRVVGVLKPRDECVIRITNRR